MNEQNETQAQAKAPGFDVAKTVRAAKITAVVAAGTTAYLGVTAVMTAGLADAGHAILDWF